MNISESDVSTLDRVAAVSSELTRTERRIAEAVLAEPTLLAFGTVSDLAGRVGTSRPSVVRFAVKLGFDGYSDLQEHVRSDLSRRLSRPSERIRSDDEFASPARARVDDGISSVFDALQRGRIGELAAAIATADNVWIVSGETSLAGAHALHSGLSMVRPGVHSLRDHFLVTDLNDAGSGDVAIVFDFFRYRRQVLKAARVFAQSRASLIAVTDSPLSPLAELADTWCRIEIPAVGPFDSSVPVVLFAELLVAQVANELKDDATRRIDRIEVLWKETEVFV